MNAEQYVSAHGEAFTEWLQENTEECECDVKYGNDETRQRGDVINADTEILCRRCFVPVGLQDVATRSRSAPGA